jgi:hypothetical protein
MKKSRFPALGLAVCFLLTACGVDSDSPLAPPESASVDNRLLGDWVATNGDIIHFSPKDAHWMETMTTSPKASNYSTVAGKTPEPDLFFITTIGNDTYMSMRIASKDEAGPRMKYCFFRYAIAPDQTLHMWAMSQDEMAAAVRAGKIKGTVHENGTMGNPPRTNVDVHLTDTSANIVKFISRHDATDLFDDDNGPLVRVRTAGD